MVATVYVPLTIVNFVIMLLSALRPCDSIALYCSTCACYSYYFSFCSGSKLSLDSDLLPPSALCVSTRYYTDMIKTLSTDQRVNRFFFNLGLACTAGLVVVILYVSLWIPYIQRRRSHMNEQSREIKVELFEQPKPCGCSSSRVLVTTVIGGHYYFIISLSNISYLCHMVSLMHAYHVYLTIFDDTCRWELFLWRWHL